MANLRFFVLSLLFFISSVVSAISQSKDQIKTKKFARILSKPFIGDDGRVYTCSDNDFFSFESNGSIAWSLHLNFKCNTGFSPVYSGLNQMLVLAENRILRIKFPENGTKSEPELFYDPGETVIGFAVSVSTSSVYITVKNHGLYAFNIFGQQLWIAEPKTERFGYRLGCRKNYENCSFDSKPVIDSCESRIYISNNEGELYSISLHGPYYQWIQDFSLEDQFFTVTPGNNGLIYVVFATKSLLFALDSFSGDILWRKTVGPLADSASKPVVDINSWVSIGSLDGSLYTFSRSGELYKIPKTAEIGSMIQVEPLLDCSGTGVYVSYTKLKGEIDHNIENYSFKSAKIPVMAVFKLVIPETGSIYWSQSYSDEIIPSFLEGKDLQHFVLDERIVLAFLAASGDRFRCRFKHEKLASSCSFAEPEHIDIFYMGNERAIIWFSLFEFVVLIVFAVLVRFCFVFWKKKKLQDRPLHSFLEKRRLLYKKRREIDMTITKLRNESNGDGFGFTVSKIGDLVKERETLKKRLSSSYSLGRDKDEMRSEDCVLPLYRGEGSRSFVSILETSSSDESSVPSSEHQDDDLKRKLKGKSLARSEGSSNDGDYDGDDDDDDESCGVASSRRSMIDLKRKSLSFN